MKIFEHLSKEQKMQLSKSSKKNTKTKSKKKENLSYKDIEELMGIRMDTYTRRNGAVRRK